MTESLAGLAPSELWRHFGELSKIPRAPGQEQAALEYVRTLAEERGAGWRQDDFGNLILFVKGEGGAPVAIQAHLDMVCEKEPEVTHDFATDPIRLVRDGDWVRADGTTLGADNGIGAAAALALLTSEGIERGPLELVFTVQEETGLHGALAFDADLMQSKILINLDSEDPDELTVGCAGGATIEINPLCQWEEVPEGWVGRELVVSGLQGGHSGLDIHKPLANAIKVLASALGGLRHALEVRVAGVEGGRAHNVIPREARARIAVSPASAPSLAEAVASIGEQLAFEWEGGEPGLVLGIAEIPAPTQVLSGRSEDGVVGLLNEVQHGAQGMSESFPEKVETSSNLAQVSISPERAVVVASVRSLSAHKLFRTRTAMSHAAMKIGAKVTVVDSYPGWEPELDAPLLKVASEQYAKVNGRPPSIQVVHAGLECGVLVSKKPEMQAISFGPLITGAHSPNERVDTGSVDAMWRLLVGLLGDLSR